METHVIRQANAVTTICDGLRRDIIDRGVSEDKVTVIPNAVDPQRFQLGGEPDPALQQRWGLAGQRVLGFIGSFYAYEGLALLIQALPAIIAAVPQTKLLLVGGGPQEENLKTLAQQLGLHDKVIFTGRVPNQQVEEYYNLVDVLVYPRLSMRLTELVTPLKPLEAMAQGRLFVASDVGGHKELVQDGVTGRLFKAGDAQALAASVVDVLAHPEQWPRYKAAGRAYVERERNWPVSVARYQGIYQSLLAGRKSR
jgi:PEP-CTERM/exosortase A-associated glycosyltransferase